MPLPPALRTAVKQAGVLVLAAGALAAMSGLWNPPRSWPEPDPEGVISLAAALGRKPPVLWIDVRSAAEFDQAHIPGALLLNEEQWDSLLPKVLEQWEPGQPSVIYCRSQGCQESQEVAERLREMQLGPVFVLNGGWETWKQK